MIEPALMLTTGIMNAVGVALCLPGFKIGARPK